MAIYVHVVYQMKVMEQHCTDLIFGMNTGLFFGSGIIILIAYFIERTWVIWI
jgi:hypothetical protein